MRRLGFLLLLFVGVVTAPARAQDELDAARPIRGFVYIEPFEIRFEMTIALPAIEEGQGLDGPVDRTMRVAILDALRPRLREQCRVRIDGVPSRQRLIGLF